MVEAVGVGAEAISGMCEQMEAWAKKVGAGRGGRSVHCRAFFCWQRGKEFVTLLREACPPARPLLFDPGGQAQARRPRPAARGPGGKGGRPHQGQAGGCLQVIGQLVGRSVSQQRIAAHRLPPKPQHNTHRITPTQPPSSTPPHPPHPPTPPLRAPTSKEVRGAEVEATRQAMMAALAESGDFPDVTEVQVGRRRDLGRDLGLLISRMDVRTSDSLASSPNMCPPTPASSPSQLSNLIQSYLIVFK
jgi:hypothetical protein